MAHASKMTWAWALGLSVLIFILWPLLTLPAKVFSLGYFKFWIILSLTWGSVAGVHKYPRTCPQVILCRPHRHCSPTSRFRVIHPCNIVFMLISFMGTLSVASTRRDQFTFPSQPWLLSFCRSLSLPHSSSTSSPSEDTNGARCIINTCMYQLYSCPLQH